MNQIRFGRRFCSNYSNKYAPGRNFRSTGRAFPGVVLGSEQPQPQLQMDGSVAIVTGGNRGLGKEVARHLLFQNTEVVLACRNMTACEVARAELTSDFQSEFPDKPCKCRCEHLDVEDHDSIRAFSKSMAKQHPGNIKLLVNNAGAPSFPPLSLSRLSRLYLICS